MGVPSLSPRVEKGNEHASGGVKGSDIWPLEAIALVTCIGEIIEYGPPTMLDSDDVIYLMWSKSLDIGHGTILAAVASTRNDVPAHGSADPLAHVG